jgi:hypothetical protein
MSWLFTIYLDILFLKASAHFTRTAGAKNFTFCKKYLVIKYINIIQVKKNHMSSAIDLQNMLKNLGVEILNNLKAIEHMLKECFPLNFTSLKFK